MDSLYLNVFSCMILLLVCYVAIPLRSNGSKAFFFFILIAVLFYGFTSFLSIKDGWDEGVAVALRLSIFSTLSWFALICLGYKVAAKLGVFVLPYLTILSLGVLTCDFLEAHEHNDVAFPSGWITGHILTSLSTYATVSLATMAALSVVICQLLIKSKRPNKIVNYLPAITEADRLQTTLLLISLVILIVGVSTGMAVEYTNSGSLFVFDHKTILTICTLILILFLLVSNKLFGFRGKIMSRFILVAYFLISLGYLGVKVISQYFV